MKVLGLVRFDRHGASSRYRTHQFVSPLRREGIQLDVVPFFRPSYLNRRYRTGGRPFWEVCAAFARRLKALTERRQYDLLWIEKELLPWVPAWFEARLLRGSTPYIVDYDDATFHRYDSHASLLIRRLLGRKIDSMMRHALFVTAANPYIRDRALAAGAARVEYLPTVVDLDRYSSQPPAAQPVFTVGWIGTPLTARYLAEIAPAIRELYREGECRMVAIGAGHGAPPDLPVEVQPWSEDSEVAQLRQLDVGVMPVPDQPIERGKSGLKLIQYMACHLPVIGSPVGVNREIIQPDVCGYFAEGAEQWLLHLRRLQHDVSLRQMLGRSGRQRVEQDYSLQRWAPRLAELLRGAASRRKAA